VATGADIQEAAARMGVIVSREAADKMLTHLDLLRAANAKFNLTAIKDEDWLWAHVLDSLSCTPEVEASLAGRLADLGSGGGFPGVPVALATGRDVTLVESVKKKAAFLGEVVTALGLAGRVEAVRAEDLALSEESAFSVVTARALSALGSLVELGSPLLKRGGRLICLKGDPRAEELESGEVAARLCGMSYSGSRDVAIPGSDAARTIVVYERTGPAKIHLPRRPGMAQRQPLA
jgi:16S rRNA (guanine527-N7)-methyltransferase